MPDPLDVLPYELWVCCIAFAVDGRETGPLELLLVSRRWQRGLLDTPSLWTQIYIQNGKNEIARIATFLHLSGGCSLHVDIMTALPTMDSLELILDHISRVTTISIRPGASDTTTALQMKQWKQAASYVLARLSSGLLALDVKHASCFGISIRENNHLYNCIVLIQFTITTTENSTVKRNRINSAELPATAYSQMWKGHIIRVTRMSADQDTDARTNSIYSLAKLASCARHHGAIRIAIPSCVKLLRDDNHSVRSAATEALYEFAVHVELCEALTMVVPSLIEALDNGDHHLRCNSLSLLENLDKYGEFHEQLRLGILLLIKQLEHRDSAVQSAAVSRLGKLAEHDQFHETLKFAIPLFIKLLEHENPDVCLDATFFLGRLAKSACGFASLSTRKLSMDNGMKIRLRGRKPAAGGQSGAKPQLSPLKFLEAQRKAKAAAELKAARTKAAKVKSDAAATAKALKIMEEKQKKAGRKDLGGKSVKSKDEKEEEEFLSARAAELAAEWSIDDAFSIECNRRAQDHRERKEHYQNKAKNDEIWASLHAKRLTEKYKELDMAILATQAVYDKRGDEIYAEAYEKAVEELATENAEYGFDASDGNVSDFSDEERLQGDDLWNQIVLAVEAKGEAVEDKSSYKAEVDAAFDTAFNAAMAKSSGDFGVSPPRYGGAR